MPRRWRHTVIVTVHPSSILRAPDGAARYAAYPRFRHGFETRACRSGRIAPARAVFCGRFSPCLIGIGCSLILMRTSPLLGKRSIRRCGRPVVAHAVVPTRTLIAASYEARAYGVRAGQRVAEATRRVVPPFASCRRAGRAVSLITMRWSKPLIASPPVTAVLSIDEMACRLRRQRRACLEPCAGNSAVDPHAGGRDV